MATSGSSNNGNRSAASEVDALNRSLSNAATEAARLARTTRKLEQSMDDASNGAIDKAASALEALAKQSSILEDSVKANITANKQAPKELAKVMDRLEKQGDALIVAQKNYRSTLKQIQDRQRVAMAAAAGVSSAEHKAKREAQRETARTNRALAAQLTALGISAQNATGKIDALAAEAKANKQAIQQVANDLNKPSAKIGKSLDAMHSKVQNSIEGLGKFTVVMELAKRAITEVYGQSIRLANRGLLGSMASMNIAALKLKMTAQEFEDVVSANRDMIAVMGGGARGIDAFAAIVDEASVGLEVMGKEGKKAAATILGSFNRAGFGLMSGSEDIRTAYQQNIKGINKQFKLFNSLFGDTAEQFAALYEQQLKSEALQARLLSGDTKTAALQMKELMVRTETLKLMGLSNDQILDMSKRVDSLFNPKENRQAEAQTERIASRQALLAGANLVQGQDPDISKKVSAFVTSGEAERYQQMSSEGQKTYQVQNAELFKAISKMDDMITAQKDSNGRDTSLREYFYTDRAKAGGREFSTMSDGIGKSLNQRQAEGYNQSQAGQTALKRSGNESAMSDLNGETTELGKAFGKLRDAVELTTAVFNNPFSSAITAIGAALLFSSTSITSIVKKAATTVFDTARLMTTSIRGFLKGLWSFARKLPGLGILFDLAETALDVKNTSTEDYEKRTGLSAGDSFLGNVGVRAFGALTDLGASAARNISFGVWDPSKNFADKQGRQPSSSAIPSASMLPNAAKPSSSASGSPYDFNSYATSLAARESGGNDRVINSLGYVGKYQFGAAALIDLGYVKPGTKNSGLANDSNWTIPGGLNAFLSNPGMQDAAFKKYTDTHYDQLKKAGVITDSSTPGQVAGYLATAHLKGVGGAIDLSQGKNGFDAYGTSASSYFAMGQSTQSLTGPSSSPLVTPQTAPPAVTAAASPAAPSVPTMQGSTASSTTPNGTLAELQQHTRLLNMMVTLLSKTGTSARSYQMDQQAGISVAN